MNAPCDKRVVVNGAFRRQRVTGQQRYASEIADRLVRIGIRELRPSRFWSRSALRTWIWSLVILPILARHDVLVSLTARGPLWHPRHVVAVHDLFVLTNPEWYSRSYVLSHVPMLRLQLRWSQAVVAVSQPVADQVAESTRTGPITLAPNAPSDLFATGAPSKSLPERFGLERGSFLLAIGSLDPRKNLARLSAAWAQVPESERLACPLLVVGGGAAIYASADLEWPTGTELAGYVSDAELAGLYGAARGVVFVSLAEGFGLPIIEAAAAGVDRLLLSDIEVFHWIAGDAAVYVDPLSELEMTAALRRIIVDERWPAARIDADRFAWDRSASAVLAAAYSVRDA